MEETQTTEQAEVSQEPSSAPQTEAQPTPQPEAPAETAPAEAQPAKVDDLYQGPDTEAEQQTAEQTPEPVQYDFEGVTSEAGEITEADISAVKALSEELKLTNEQARALLSKSGKSITDILRAKQGANINNWINEIKADPNLGGSNFKTTQANLARAMKRYGGSGAFEVLRDSGLGAHPAIVKMLNAIGKELGEETKFVNSKSQAPKPKNPLRSIYDNSPDLNFGD